MNKSFGYLLSLVSEICKPIKPDYVYGGLDVEVGDYRGNVWAMLWAALSPSA